MEPCLNYSVCSTSLAVGLPLFYVEGTIADGCSAGSADKALNVPGHLQSMHNFLKQYKNVSHSNEWIHFLGRYEEIIRKKRALRST